MCFSYKSLYYGKEADKYHVLLKFDSDAVNDLALHYLAKMKVLVVQDIEREDIDFIARVCTCLYYLL